MGASHPVAPWRHAALRRVLTARRLRVGRHQLLSTSHESLGVPISRWIAVWPASTRRRPAVVPPEDQTRLAAAESPCYRSRHGVRPAKHCSSPNRCCVAGAKHVAGLHVLAACSVGHAVGPVRRRGSGEPLRLQGQSTAQTRRNWLHGAGSTRQTNGHPSGRVRGSSRCARARTQRAALHQTLRPSPTAPAPMPSSYKATCEPARRRACAKTPHARVLTSDGSGRGYRAVGDSPRRLS